MEYSPMMVVMLWALTPSDCLPTAIGGEPARVVEMPQPIMSVHPEGYFTFNHGRPFLAERDPITGAIESNIKTTPVTSDDYMYEEYEESAEEIDRKDSTKIYTRNDITSPSKDSDLHKFLNLPVHYSSSGKFPLISSSYANTKVQGHGPLSNHKLYTSTTSTTSTVSPSYYPFKTTPPPSTTIATTSTSTSTTTSKTSISTTSPTTIKHATNTFNVSTLPTSSTDTSPRVTKKTTTTSKPLLPIYEYEYDYDYDKSDGEGTEKTSHDYEFLGASSEVTMPDDKIIITTLKPSNTFPPLTQSTKTQATLISSTTTIASTTNKDESDLESTISTLKSETKPIPPAKNEQNQNSSKFSHNVENSSIHQDETVDLKPPKPEISLELRPPQAYPTRPYSSVVPTKPQNIGHLGFVRYPNSPILVSDKKPLSVHTSENVSKTKTEFSPFLPLQVNPNSFLQEEKQNSSTQSKPQTSLETQKDPLNKDNIEPNVSPAVSHNQDTLETIFGLDSLFKNPSIMNKNNLVNNKDKIKDHPSINPKPISSPDPVLSLPSQAKPFDKLKDSLEVVKRPNISRVPDHKIPEGVGIIVASGEELVPEHNKHPVVLQKPEYRPHDFPEQSKIQGGPTGLTSKPPQEHKSEITIQGHAKPTISFNENNKHHGLPNTDPIRIQRPQSTLPENSRLQIKIKPDVIRPQIVQSTFNNKPIVHFTTDQIRSPSYQILDPHHPPNNFGLRIQERPTYVPDRLPGVEQLRPHNVHHESKKPNNGMDIRPHQSVVGDVRPAESKKPNIGVDIRPYQTIVGDVRPAESKKPIGGVEIRPYYQTIVGDVRPSESKKPNSGVDIRPYQTVVGDVRPTESKVPNSGIDIRPYQTVVGEVRPAENIQRPDGSSKPIIFSKPQSGKRPDYNAVQFGQSSKTENHFISVSPGHDNPSYSLQTSFSIGVPPPEQKQTNTGASHGVGQVLFPDEEAEKRPPIWSQRPPINQPDSQPNIQVEKYPRPSWESHLKPPHHMYHKKEPYSPIKRKPLPNILPQFRPNAKIGQAEPHFYLKPREPFDTLQPPPLPRPQFLRLEQDIEETKPLVHRRNGQTNSRVTTLQMMQGPPAVKRPTLRVDDTNEKNEPVFVVYPSNGNNPASPPSDGVVVGTRGSQRPLPPDNLDIGDDLDSFPLDNNKNFQARVDTPILKSKSPTSKPIIKNDFPYTLIKPLPEERITTGNVVTKEYTAFSPTVPSIEKDHDSEINIIPYLQDYMPFATKKPSHKDAWLLGTDIKHLSATISSKLTGTEMTPPPHKIDNHRLVSEGPQPQDFQAPFHASLTAPSQGWSVVQKKPSKENNNQEVTTTKEISEVQTTIEPKFDIQNFKPQLFGGFKPIVPPEDNENKEKKRI